MNPRTLVLGSLASVAIIAAGWTWGWYEAYATADKACRSLRQARSLADAVGRLREGGAVVSERDGRTVGAFRFLGVAVGSCSFRFVGGKVADLQWGSDSPGQAR